MPTNRRLLTAAAALTLLGGGALFLACSPPPTTKTGDVQPTSTAARPAGKVACGSLTCSAGTEMCCLGKTPRCIPIPATKPGDDPVRAAAFARWDACGHDNFLLCDDAGDCHEGETCCSERDYGSDSAAFSQGVCLPLRQGKVACAYAELCSADDPRCVRKDNVCGGDESSSRKECSVPARLRGKPLCGSAKCADGMSCVATKGHRECVPGVLSYVQKLGVIECDRGRDCAEDESCFKNPQAEGHRCDWNIAGVDGLSEPALCEAKEDCTGYCRNDTSSVASCHVGEEKVGRCECLPRCSKDEECENCMAIMVSRGGGNPEDVGFCDKKKGACDCRAPASAP